MPVETIDYAEKLSAVARKIAPEEAVLSESAAAMAALEFAYLDARYGPNAKTPKEYHNAPHSLSVFGRGVRLANLLYAHIPEDYRTDLYDLIAVGSAFHDHEQALVAGANEQASMDAAINELKRYSELNHPRFAERLHKGGMVTVAHHVDGKIIQPNLRKGEPDPYDFIMSFADINGIAMEGPARMMQDATNLCFEINGNPNVQQLYDFYVSQVGFIRHRLNDAQIKGDIAYYFPDSADEVYAIMRKAFHKNILAAHGLALGVSENPGVKVPLEFALRRLDHSVFSNVVSRAIRRYVAVQ